MKSPYEWKDISEGMTKNYPYEVMQKGGDVSLAAFIVTDRFSGICKLKRNDKGELCSTNTFLMKVEKFRDICT